MAKQHAFQAPRGTRDFLPVEAARRRWLLEHWRRVSTRHGFEEIDGPTFEHLDLYTVKSGEGIVSELFSFKREGGEDTYALRPEFTPTLARMYAARANSLPKPTKWFCVSNFFRAERPQRGRLREFWQWNADVIGLEGGENDTPEAVEQAKARADAEAIGLVIGLLTSLGLNQDDLKIVYNNRDQLCRALVDSGVREDSLLEAVTLLDKLEKLAPDQFRDRALKLGFPEPLIALFTKQTIVLPDELKTKSPFGDEVQSFVRLHPFFQSGVSLFNSRLISALNEIDQSTGWLLANSRIVRGLAYYTGTVFEVIADGERAVAGGGRYDHLIELFGGPPTPAVGFGMGDVVLCNLLTDKGLMPSDAELMEWAGQSPQVFVLCPADERAEAQVRPMVAGLRRAGVHARHTYKSTRNIGKLLKEASGLGARIALLIEPGGEVAKIKHLIGEGGESEPIPLEQSAERLIRELAPTDAPPSRQSRG